MINMDKKSHKLLTILFYVVFAAGYIVIILGNDGPALLPLVIYTVIVIIAIYSHMKYYNYKKVNPKAKIVLVVNMVLMFIFLYYDQSPLEQYFLLILIADCIFAFHMTFSRRYIIATYLIFYPYMIITSIYNNSGYYLDAFIEDIVISVICVVILYMFKSQMSANVRYNELLVESDEAYKKLKKYSVKVEELVIVEERNRIALILHNSIGHSLTSIMLSLQAEKMELVSKKQVDKDAFETVERLIQDAMKLLRSTIESADDFMKDMPFDDLMDMFIREASNNTRVNISYNSCHTSYIQDEQKSVIFNVVIESITNAMKHSGCKKIQVSINGNANAIFINILDDGCGFDTIKYGYGITKMKEQIQEIGGKYEFISQEGCEIRVILPIKEVKVDD